MFSAYQLNIRILGPLSIHLEHHVVMPSAAKQRQILSMLALHPGQPVTVSRLADELWGDHPPPSYVTALQSYIYQLRKRLEIAMPGQDAKEILRTGHSCYSLECRTDVQEFKRLAHAGRVAMEEQDPQKASDLLGQALALWHGRALADVRRGPVLEIEATALEAIRLSVLERRIVADLALHRHADILGELTQLTAQYPVNENFCGLLMTALYRSGYVTRALEIFHRLRTVLNMELGIEPSTRLQRLHLAILSGDLALDSDDARRDSGAGRGG